MITIQAVKHYQSSYKGAYIENTKIVSFAIVNLFILFNTRAKMNNIDSTRLAPLSINKLTAEYWNSNEI